MTLGSLRRKWLNGFSDKRTGKTLSVYPAAAQAHAVRGRLRKQNITQNDADLIMNVWRPINISFSFFALFSLFFMSDLGPLDSPIFSWAPPSFCAFGDGHDEKMPLPVLYT